MKIINLEYKMPTREQARIRLDQALRDAKREKQPVLKLIHGYGSSGKGGVIKEDIVEYLAELEKEKKIKSFVIGEDFNPFHLTTQELLKRHPQIYKDKDYSRDNRGITLVIL